MANLVDIRESNVVLGAQTSAINTAATTFNQNISYPTQWGVSLERGNQLPIRSFNSKKGRTVHRLKGLDMLNGQVSGALAPDCASTGFLLASIFENNTVTGSSEYTHVFNGQRLVPQFGFTANVQPGGIAALTVNQIGMFVKQFNISKSDQNSPINFSLDLVGCTESANGADKETLSVSEAAPYEARKAKIEIKAGEGQFTSMTEVIAKSFDIAIPTGVDLTTGGQSDSYTNRYMASDSDITVNFDIDQDTQVVLNNLFKQHRKMSVQITFDHDQEASAGNPYQVKIQLPCCYIQSDSRQIGESNPNPNSFSVVADMPLSGPILHECQITVIDATSGVYSV